LLGLPVERANLPVGCNECRGTGYRERKLLTEMLVPDRPELRRAILAREDADTIEQLAVAGGMASLWQAACDAINQGMTSPAEVRRVLGFRDRGQTKI
jgi:type II secretory ATPase GspE/PulE/Tfp pilus assembly ATPase PilB-like protein